MSIETKQNKKKFKKKNLSLETSRIFIFFLSRNEVSWSVSENLLFISIGFCLLSGRGS